MMLYRILVVSLLVMPLGSCVVGSSSELHLMHDDAAAIERFEVDPTTIPLGGEFAVRWEIAHTGATGDVYLYTLYLAGPEALDAAASLDDVPQFFSRADLGGVLSADPGEIHCVRPGLNRVACLPFGELAGLSAASALQGEQPLTLEVCDLNQAFDPGGRCDRQTRTVLFLDER